MSITFSDILFIIFAVFAVLGGLDYVFGSRLGLGKAFERGIVTMGPLALAMTGMIVLAPVLADVLAPVVLPLFNWMGVDPAMFAGSLLACDMGGAPLADKLANDPQGAVLGGIICASLLGATITFTIPVAMGIIREEDRSFAAKGILCGIITVPLGILAGGLVAGIPALKVLRNLLPTLLPALLIALGLWKFERLIIRLFTYFGKFMTALATVGLLLALIQKFTPLVILRGMAPVGDAFHVVGEIAFLLAGAFPMMELISRLLRKPLMALGRKMGVNEHSVMGFLNTSVNSIATFDALEKMDARGKVLNMAFAVSGAFVFGDHLAFTGGWNPSAIPALIVGKLAAGLTALLLALLMTRGEGKKGNMGSVEREPSATKGTS
jgi:ethanolamine transporter